MYVGGSLVKPNIQNDAEEHVQRGFIFHPGSSRKGRAGPKASKRPTETLVTVTEHKTYSLLYLLKMRNITFPETI